MNEKQDHLSPLHYPRRFIPPADGTPPLETPQQRSRFGSPLLSVVGEDPKTAGRRIFVVMWGLITIAHFLGAVICLAIILNLVPGISLFHTPFRNLTLYGVPAYLVIAYLLGMAISFRYIERILIWFVDQRTPTVDDRDRILAAPWRMVLVQASLWLVGAAIFGFCYGQIAPWIAPRIVITVVLGAMIMSAICYLQVEFALRPAAAAVLDHWGRPARRTSGLAIRFVIVWLAGTVVPLVGLLLVSVYTIVTQEFSNIALARYVSTLVLVTFIYSAVLFYQLSSYIDPPLDLVRHGMEQVSQGNLDTEIAVFDATEIGELQTGFNHMVAELREQERIKHLFSRHVGDKVARYALMQREEMPVTQRNAAVFFIDIIGSTKLSLEYSSHEVVGILNRFYTIVVEEVQKTGGMVNKFAGDAVLALYNVPDDHPDPAGAALYCARIVMHRIEREIPEIAAAAGVSSGLVVAGTIGSPNRYEYTVIGDPVNVASRLTELAKRVPGRILAAQRTVNLANPEEAGFWMIDGATVLRGHTEATVLASPEQHVVMPFSEEDNS